MVVEILVTEHFLLGLGSALLKEKLNSMSSGLFHMTSFDYSKREKYESLMV